MVKYDKISITINTLIAGGIIATLGLGYLLYNQINDTNIPTNFYNKSKNTLEDKINESKQKLKKELEKIKANEERMIFNAYANETPYNFADKYTLFFITTPDYASLDKPALTQTFISLTDKLKKEYVKSKDSEPEYNVRLNQCINYADIFFTETKIKLLDYLMHTKNLSNKQQEDIKKEIKLVDNYFNIK